MGTPEDFRERINNLWVVGDITVTLPYHKWEGVFPPPPPPFPEIAGYMVHDCNGHNSIIPVMFSRCVYLKTGHRFHALVKVCSDCDDIVP